MDEWMRWQPTRARRFDAFVLTPARVTVGIGALLAGIAGVMPWATGTTMGHGGLEDAFFSGLGGSGDGIVLILLSAGTAFLVLHHTPASSRIRLVHAIPYVLVALSAITVVNGYRGAELEIAAWERRGGSGSIAPGLWIATAGVVLQAAGMIALLPGLVRWRRASNDPADLMTVSGQAVLELVGGLIGMLIGGAIGIQFAVSLTTLPLMGLVMLLAILGALLGAYAGAWSVRWAVGAIRDRRGSGTP